MTSTGISCEIRTKLRDWAIWQARAGCYSQAALSSNDSKTCILGGLQIRMGSENANNVDVT